MPDEKKGAIHFLATDIPKEELASALKVIKDFMTYGTHAESLVFIGITWLKMNQLKELLEYLVEGKALEDDSLRAAKKEGVL